MEFSDQLIRRFFSGNCTEEEKKWIMEYIKDNPDALAQYLTEAEWENFDEDGRPEHVPTQQIRQSIEKKVGLLPVRRLSVAWIAAAAVVSAVCLVVFFRPHAAEKGNPTGLLTDSAVSAPVAVKKAPAPQPELRFISNTTAHRAAYSLPDGSKMELAGQSRVSFYQPFIGRRRDIFLDGDAIFTVRKDKSMLFSVYSRGIMTTALGTIFRVNDKNPHTTRVHLFSGRVVVSATMPAGKKFKDIYLLPGQQMIVDNESLVAKVQTDEPAAVAGEMPAHLQLAFSRQSLAEVFSLLERDCHVKITYRPATMKNIDFTGSFDSGQESLESFLNTLCILNELECRKTGNNHFSIKEK